MPQPKKPVNKQSPKTTSAAGPAKPFARNFKLQAALIFLFSFLLYANTLGHQYALDDDLMIRDNKFTKQGFSGIGKILTTDALAGVFGEQNLLQGGRYRPLSQILFAIEYELFGLNPFIGHLINILLYGLLCVVLFHVLRKIFADFKTEKWYFGLPFIVTALFAVHPLHTEAVANIKGRDEIMSLLGSLGSLWFALKYCENKKPLNLLWAALIFILALLSKENAVTFIAVIPLTMHFFSHAKGKEYLMVSAALIAGFAMYALIRYNALGFLMNSYEETELFNNPFAEATVSQKYATIVFTWFCYIGLIVFGNPLTHDYYPYQVSLHEWSDFSVILSLVIYAFLAVVAIIKLKRKSLISFAILFFAVTFSIQSNLFLNIGTFMNERFMFVALIGFCIVVAVFFRRLSGDDQSGKKVWPKLALYLFLFLIVTFSSLTINRNKAWKNSETLFLTDVKTSVNSARCNYLAGFTLLEKARKELDAAKKNELYNQSALYLERGLKIYGKNTSALGNLGEVYIALGRYEEARSMYVQVLEQLPGDPVSISNLRVVAKIFIRDTRFAEAIELLNSLALMLPNDPTDYNIMGEVYGRHKNDLDSAEIYFEKSLKRDSTYAPALENMGLISGMRGNYQKSLEYLLLAYPLDSANVDLLRNLSSTYTNLGNMQKAEELDLKAAVISAQ